MAGYIKVFYIWESGEVFAAFASLLVRMESCSVHLKFKTIRKTYFLDIINKQEL